VWPIHRQHEQRGIHRRPERPARRARCARPSPAGRHLERRLLAASRAQSADARHRHRVQQNRRKREGGIGGTRRTRSGETALPFIVAPPCSHARPRHPPPSPCARSAAESTGGGPARGAAPRAGVTPIDKQEFYNRLSPYHIRPPRRATLPEHGYPPFGENASFWGVVSGGG